MNERMNQLIAENERLQAELTTANSMHVDAVRFIWEQRGFGCCAEMAEHFDKAIAERDALAAQVGAFAAMIIEVRSADESKYFLGSDWHERSDGLMVSIPEHHLAAHDAEVAAKAVLEFAAKLLVNQKVDVIDCAKTEADQLRAKAGE